MLIIVTAFRLLNYTQTAFKSVHTQTIIQDRNYKKNIICISVCREAENMLLWDWKRQMQIWINFKYKDTYTNTEEKGMKEENTLKRISFPEKHLIFMTVKIFQNIYVYKSHKINQINCSKQP